jgi:hypothetical protein
MLGQEELTAHPPSPNIKEYSRNLQPFSERLEEWRGARVEGWQFEACQALESYQYISDKSWPGYSPTGNGWLR